MTEEERKRLKQLMRRAHRGQGLGGDEQSWLETMYRTHGEEYAALHREVKEEAAREINPWLRRSKDADKR
jgi:hypothetical protein